MSPPPFLQIYDMPRRVSPPPSSSRVALRIEEGDDVVVPPDYFKVEAQEETISERVLEKKDYVTRSSPPPTSTSATAEHAENVVVEYVALEDFLMDQGPGLVAETTAGTPKSTFCSSNNLAVEDPALLAGNDQYLRMLPTAPVPVQIVRPQQQIPPRRKSDLLDDGKGEELRNEHWDKRRAPSGKANCSPAEGQGKDIASLRASSLETLADAAASVVGSLREEEEDEDEYEEEDDGDDIGLVQSSSSSQRRTRRNRNPIPEDLKDQRYWERRLKNNVAAKRSRESKRAKENQLSIKVAYLEKEHNVLMSEIQLAQSINRELRDRLSKYERVDGEASTTRE